MNVEASIVERLHKLKQWQLEQQDRLLKQQQIQREMLSQKQDCMFKALELSIQELDLSDDPLSTSNLNETVGDVELDNKNVIIQSQTKEDCAQALNDSELYDNQDGNNILQGITSERRSPEDELMENSIKNRTEQRYLNDKETCDTESNINVIITTPERKKQMEKFQMDGVAPLTPDKSFTKHHCLDDIPIPSPRKDFYTLLEEKIKDCENESFGRNNVEKHMRKMPFLRKGEGLLRLKLNKSISSPNRKEQSKPSTNTQFKNDKRSNKDVKRSKSAQLPKNMHVQKKLSLKNVPLPKKKTLSKSKPKSTVHMEDRANESKETVESSTVEFQSGTQKELEEVRIFELLEEKAENSSFCSTSSTVIAFLQQSTPYKMKTYGHKAESIGIGNEFNPVPNDNTSSKSDQICTTPSKNPGTYSNLLPCIVENLNELYGNMCLQSASGTSMSETNGDRDTLLNTQVQSLYNQQDVCNVPSNANDNDVSLHVRFSEHNQYKTIGLTDTSSISTDSVTTKSFQDYKIWSDSSTPETSVMESSQNNNSTESDDFMCNSKQSSYVYHRNESNVLNTSQSLADEDNLWKLPKKFYSTESSNMEKCDNNNDDVVVIIDEENKKNSEEANETIFKSELLKERLLELDKEINIFRKENAALSSQRKKLQEDYRNMEREFSEREKTFETLRKQTERELQEEKKKLAREKAALGYRMRISQERAHESKQDKQEIQRLRETVEKLIQEMREKENKRNATESRHKCEMRVLKVENAKLKKEVEELQTLMRGKVKNIGRPRAANTKAIHQINNACNFNLPKRPTTFNNPTSETYEKFKQMKAVRTKKQSPVAGSSKARHSGDGENMNGKPQGSQTSPAVVMKKRNLYESLINEAIVDLPENQRKSSPLENFNRPQSNSQVRILVDTTNTMQSNSETFETFKANTQVDEENDRGKSELVNKEPNSNIENISPDENAGELAMEQMKYRKGSVEDIFMNGNIKNKFPGEDAKKYTYPNGDIFEITRDGIEKYYYAEAGTWQMKMPEGLEIIEFADGQVERRWPNGIMEASFPDGSFRILELGGIEKWTLPNGVHVTVFPNGEKHVILPNGQREIHTDTHKRREYPDGTVKIIFPDGTQETQYSNGRIRAKDKDGRLLMDCMRQDRKNTC